jgi:hypothetical protein
LDVKMTGAGMVGTSKVSVSGTSETSRRDPAKSAYEGRSGHAAERSRKPASAILNDCATA